MNCIGPTARSHWVSPSRVPWSVSRIEAVPTPLSTGPRILPLVLPLASTRPPLAWFDSTLPIPASSGQVSPHAGYDRAAVVAARWYAGSTLAGIPVAAPVSPVPSVGLPGRAPVTGTGT